MLSLLALIQQVPRSGADTIPRDTLFRARDTLAAVAGAVRDTVTPPPLPGGVAAFVRFLFRVPQWIQIGGVIVAAVVAFIVLAFLWRRHGAMLTWLRTRSRQVQLTLGGAVALVLLLAAFTGKRSWDYMQHDNGFCTGCHIMERPFGRFETFSGKHENRKCHDCHQQSLFASTRQLVLWVANRPSEIGKHAAVPNSRCESCHQAIGGRKAWEHVLRLAGHRVHFESDSSSLQKLQCVKCHGAEIHHFIPSNRTCQQTGCHVQQSVRLAGMAKLPAISCVTCHAFRADLPGLATLDSAHRALVPSKAQCLTCHGMQTKLAKYVAAKDPHRGSCGSCHDVHKDTKPSDARTSCVKCHATVTENPFHSGVNHRRVATQCLTCHQPHAASVDASDCAGCHAAVRQRGLFHPPLPFDTNSVIRRRVSSPASGAGAEIEERIEDHRGKGDALSEQQPPIRAAPMAVRPHAADSFPHARHTSLPCLTCHVNNRSTSKYGLVFAIPRGCDLCHHQKLMAGTVDVQDCSRCHRADQLAAPQPTPVQVAIPAHAPAVRSVDFRHDRHHDLACATCHRPPNPQPPDSVRSCTACHAQHHAAQRNCASCHFRAETPAAHSRTSHADCDACHTRERIASLIPNRNFCLTCHAAQRTHQPARECTTCHFLATPDEYRSHLLRGGGA